MTRLVLCQGKIYYDIVGHEDRERASTVAVARLEQLYPFPVEQAAELVRGYPNLREVVWAQEEPQNMGAWRAIRHRLEEAKPDGVVAPLRRPAVAREPERGLSDRAPARAGPDRPRGARAVSALSAALSQRFLPRRARCSSSSFDAAFGPCLRASSSTCLRCFGGRRRQTSKSVIATPTGPGRSFPRRGTRRSLAAVALPCRCRCRCRGPSRCP